MAAYTKIDIDAVQGRVQQVLELIRPSLQEDDGDVELVDITDTGVVHVRFLGACVGCPSNPMTLQDSIEKNIREHVPEIRRVVPVQ
jgi:Fe-S cluster biogenesis protein NfuA